MIRSSHNHFVLIVAAVLILSFAAAAHERNGLYQQRTTLVADAARKSPGKQRARHNYGCALSRAELYNEALQEFRAALALKPDGSVLMHYLFIELGISHFNLDEFDDAFAAWRHGLLHAPGNAELMNYMAMALLKKKNFNAALSYAEAASMRDPRSADIQNTLGDINSALGRYTKAAGHYVSAATLDPETPSRHWNAALALEKAGRYDDACQHVSTFLNVETDNKKKNEALLLVDRLRERKALSCHQ